MQRIFNSSRSLLPRFAQSAQKKQPYRKLSAHGGHSADKHHKAEPYAAKHGEAYSEEAYAFGIKPGAPLEGWEIPVYGVFFVASVILFYTMGYCKEDTSFTEWARREAIAREKLMDEGVEIEFGKWYQNAKFQENEIDLMPTELESE